MDLPTSSVIKLTESLYDLTNCDREPIHIPGAIQPHGILFHIDANDYHILQVSRNVESFLGISAESVVGESLWRFLSPASCEKIRVSLEAESVRESNPLNLRCNHDVSVAYDGILHRYKGALILEMEVKSSDQGSFSSFYQTVRKAVVALQNSESVFDACQTAASQIRRITNFDRVTVYKFDEDWNGNVVGEDRSEAMDSLLGQRFPASDIPAQARALYQLNWIRIISDRSYTPAPLFPLLNPLTGLPLDLSMSVLRSVSPIHIEYMANMEMMASMSVSIIKAGKLWGLISCHHKTPKYLSYQVRSSCEFLAEIFSGQMGTIETRESANQRQGLRRVLADLEVTVSGVADFASAFRFDDSILKLTNSAGAALFHKGKVYCYGRAPAEEHIVKILTWLSRSKLDFFQARSLSEHCPEFTDIAERASGILSIRISRNPDSFILWVRPEQVRSIDWAGNPTKPVEETQGDGEGKSHSSLRLHPRKSFELWREIVRGQAESFTEPEIEVAIEFKNMIISKLLEHSVRDLESSNLELDSFAQMVSHDLREPLRGIRIYANHSLQDDKGQISEATERRLEAMISLSDDLDSLLLSLYSFSKLGRVELSFENVAVLDLVQQVIARLKPICEEQNVRIEVAGSWPVLF